jgi:hypothetical protein
VYFTMPVVLLGLHRAATTVNAAEPRDVGQIGLVVAVLVDVEDVADVGPKMAAEQVDRRVHGHGDDRPVRVVGRAEDVDIIDVAVAVLRMRGDLPVRRRAAQSGGVEVVGCVRQDRCDADGQRHDRCAERGQLPRRHGGCDPSFSGVAAGLLHRAPADGSPRRRRDSSVVACPVMRSERAGG